MEISKTADEALQVLLELGRRGGRTPADLARALDMNRTVVHRHLATLAARGMTSRQIGENLFVSPRTVDNHLQQVYVKLGIKRRSELAAHLLPTTEAPPPS